MAREGDSRAMEIFHQYGMHLGNSLRLIVNLLSPEAIIIGGSISKSFSYFEEGLMEIIQSIPLKRITDKLIIERSDNDDISILGASSL